MKIEKLIVAGHGEHGKDEFCKILGLPFKSSSEIALDEVIWPLWGKFQGYVDKQECFDDRRNNRSTWFDLIVAYNTPDKARLGRKIFEQCDIYCGNRSVEEFNILREEGAFDLSVWIDASLRLPPEPSSSCTITPDMCNMVINNNGSLDEFKRKVLAFKMVVGLWYSKTFRTTRLE